MAVYLIFQKGRSKKTAHRESLCVVSGLMSLNRDTAYWLSNFRAGNLKVKNGITVGLVRGLTVPISLLALSIVVFSGPLEEYALFGFGIFLVGKFWMSIVNAFWGQYPGGLTGISVPTILVLLLIGQSIPLSGPDLYVTFIATIFVVTIACGLTQLVIGHFKLANYFRFVPYPVAAGALAGTGVTIIAIAFWTSRNRFKWIRPNWHF